MKTRLVAAGLIVLLISVIGCGGGSPTSPSGPTVQVQPSRASVTAMMSPNPVVATCVSTASLCAATVSITFSESAGLGVNVDFINSSFINTAGTVADTASYSAAKITALAGTSHIAPFGSLTIPATGTLERIGNLWSQAGGVGRVGVLAITMQLTDDRGNVLGTTVNIPVS